MNGSRRASAASRIAASDLSTHLETTGDSTSVSVFMICTDFFLFAKGRASIASQTSCTTAVLSLPPE